MGVIVRCSKPALCPQAPSERLGKSWVGGLLEEHPAGRCRCPRSPHNHHPGRTIEVVESVCLWPSAGLPTLWCKEIVCRHSVRTRVRCTKNPSMNATPCKAAAFRHQWTRSSASSEFPGRSVHQHVNARDPRLFFGMPSTAAESKSSTLRV